MTMSVEMTLFVTVEKWTLRPNPNAETGRLLEGIEVKNNSPTGIEGSLFTKSTHNTINALVARPDRAAWKPETLGLQAHGWAPSLGHG